MRLFLTSDGKSGFALKGDDIVSAFKHTDTAGSGYVKSALALATRLGGRRLDAFDTALPTFYADAGFKAVARTSWVDQYAPSDWSYDTFAMFNGGRPDVVFMVYDPDMAQAYKPGDGVTVADYDTGSAVQQASVKGIAERPLSTSPPAPTRMSDAEIQKRIVAVSQDLDFDPAAIMISSAEKSFELNGQAFKAAGTAEISRVGKDAVLITLYAQQMRPDNANGVIAHEIEHIKFETALLRASADFEKIGKEPKEPSRVDPVMNPDGSLKPPYDAKYPAYQAMVVAYDNADKAMLAASDGVSEYSYDWWKNWRTKKNTSAPFLGLAEFSAVHETLAEMARIKYDTGKFPEHMGERILDWRGPDTPKPSQAKLDANAKVWRDLYRAVDKVWRLPA